MIHSYFMVVLAFIALFIISPGDALYAESMQQQGDTEEVVVGIRVVPPFVMKSPSDSPTPEYEGITIQLWEHLAEEMDVRFRYEERDIKGLIEGVRNGELYAAASALTVTSEREELVDFTHPFYVTGLGIAVPYTPTNIWQAFMALFSPDFLYVVGLLALLLLFWGALVWLAERRSNDEEFGGSPAEGIGSGFWWAAVTMTTVGYGDKSPRTPAGRVIGFLWMFTAVIIISFFTASIASSLTVSQLDSRVNGEEDLPFVRVGILENSATRFYMEENGLRYNSYASIDEGLNAVEQDEIDTFVHDAPIIRYETSKNYQNRLRVLPNTFNDQYYGIAIPAEFSRRNEMNRLLLDFINSDAWENASIQYGIN
jgi:ABC-type amino acid transport substrate-binding protein